MIRYITCLAVLIACTPPQPVTPPNPDASDSGQPSVLDSAPMPQTPCQAACDQMGRVCGAAAEMLDCIRVMAHIESAHLIREPVSGKPQTCADVAAATDTVQMRAVGVACGR